MKGWSVMDCPGLIDLALSYVPLFQLELLNHPLHSSDPHPCGGGGRDILASYELGGGWAFSRSQVGLVVIGGTYF